MSEFDLRPFEVKKPKDIFYRARVYAGGVCHVDRLIEIYGQLPVRDMHESYGNLEVNISLKPEIQEKEWTFADIQVGWFFKSADNSIYFKVSNKLYRRVVNVCGYWLFQMATLAHKDGDILGITNVYDCPELAKVLMIERIIT